ncbi:hypothetical protein ES703_106211 [subsurface metagenome]
MADSYPVLPPAAEGGDVVPYRFVQHQVAAIYQPNGQGASHQHLGNAGQVVDRSGGNGRGVRLIGEATEGGVGQDTFPFDNEHLGARRDFFPDGAIQHGIGPAEVQPWPARPLGYARRGRIVRRLAECFCKGLSGQAAAPGVPGVQVDG